MPARSPEIMPLSLNTLFRMVKRWGLRAQYLRAVCGDPRASGRFCREPQAGSPFAFRLSPCSQCRAARGLMLVRARFRHLLEIPSATDATHSSLNLRRQSSGLPNAARIVEPGTSLNRR
jgi:hypothetical protein